MSYIVFLILHHVVYNQPFHSFHYGVGFLDKLMDKEKRVQRRLGRIFKGLRIKKHFSQRGFARHIGLDRSYYAKIEKGKADISFSTLRLISKGLEIRLGKLFLRIEGHLE